MSTPSLELEICTDESCIYHDESEEIQVIPRRMYDDFPMELPEESASVSSSVIPLQALETDTLRQPPSFLAMLDARNRSMALETLDHPTPNVSVLYVHAVRI